MYILFYFIAMERVRKNVQCIRINRFWDPVFNVAPCQSIFYYYCCYILVAAAVAAFSATADFITTLYLFNARTYVACTYTVTKRLKWHTYTQKREEKQQKFHSIPFSLLLIWRGLARDLKWKYHSFSLFQYILSFTVHFFFSLLLSFFHFLSSFHSPSRSHAF